MSTGYAALKGRQLFSNRHIATVFILLSQTCNNSPLEQLARLTPFVMGKFWCKSVHQAAKRFVISGIKW